MKRSLAVQLAVVGVLACAGTTLAQTASDDCASAPLVHGGTYPIDTTGASNDGTGSCGLSAAAPDVWFDFVPLGDGTCTFTLCDGSTDFDTVLSVFADSCSGTELACNDDQLDFACGLSSTLILDVVAGQHYLVRVAGFNNGTGTGVLHINIPSPQGACCNAGACSVTSEADCASAGGIWNGAGTNCGATTYSSELAENAFEDISASGTDSGLHCDDCTTTADIGFSFTFFGVSYSFCNISSNGNIQFDPSDNTEYFNDDQPIPSATGPNNMICPAWDDYNLNPATDGGGTIYTLTDGVAPNRRFIVSWQGVPQYFDIDTNSFQVILFEGSNNIEFRYGDMTARADAADITMGVENLDGTDGLSLDSQALIGTGHTGQLVTSVSSGGPCGADPCLAADFNHDGDRNPDDLGDFITCYFNEAQTPGGCPAADFNHDNDVNPDDLGDFITTYFGCV